LEFSPQDKFQKQTIERAENNKIIETIARQIFQVPLKIASITSSIETIPAELAGEEGLVLEEEIEETIVNGTNLQAPAAEMAPAEGDPVVRRVLDIFGGEIVNNNRKKGE